MASTRLLSTLIFAAFLFQFDSSVQAQGRPATEVTPSSERISAGAIRGRVIMPNGSFSDEAVKITLSTLRGTVATVYAETQGQFEFQGVAPGTYYLEFEANRQHYAPLNETVQVYRGMPTVISVTLRPLRSDGTTPSPDAVSVAELKEKVPAKARKEFEKASAAGANGQTDDAIEHLRNAIAIFPAFVRAHNDLGTYLLAQGKLDEAEEELRKATALDPTSFNPILNLGIVLVHKQAFTEVTVGFKSGYQLLES